MLVKIALVGHSFCGPNYGLGALAFGEVSAIKQACSLIGCDYEITCFETGINIPFDPENAHVKLQEYNLKRIAKNARGFSDFDLIFDISAGDSFSDIYGIKLFVIQMFIKSSIALSGTTYIVAPQTIGPFTRKWASEIANCFIEKAQLVFTRDELSYESLNKKNQKKTMVVSDLAFLMNTPTLRKNDSTTIGLNVSGLLYNRTGILNEDSYKYLVHGLLQYLLKSNYNIFLIPHVVGEDLRLLDNDLPVCEELSKQYSIKCIKCPNPKKVKEAISQCDLFIGSRMHATIAALSNGVPTLPLAYSRKFKGLYEAIGYQYTIDLNVATVDSVVAQIEYMLSNPDVVKADITNSLKRVQNKNQLYIEKVSEVIKACAQQ